MIRRMLSYNHAIYGTVEAIKKYHRKYDEATQFRRPDEEFDPGTSEDPFWRDVVQNMRDGEFVAIKDLRTNKVEFFSV